MPDPQSVEERCKNCWWYSSMSGERTGYCYEHEVVVKAEQFRCDEWDRNYPDKRKA